MKPKRKVTRQKQRPSDCTVTRSLIGTQGTSANCTVRITLLSCSTWLCFRLCSSACGTVSGLATAYTAVRGTRRMLAGSRLSMKGCNSRPSLRMLSINSARPRAQVLITPNSNRPRANGNQPPSKNLTAQPATSKASSARNRAVAAATSGAGNCQPSRTTNQVRTVVIIIVKVTAMPYAPANAVLLPKPTVAIITPMSSAQLTAGK